MPSEPLLVTEDGARPTDNEDIVECWDISDDPELRLTIKPGGCVEVRRGGKPGDGCVDEVRLGSGGGAFRAWC